MKYWMFQNNQVTGPYDPDDLPTVSGYSAETLVCPEGRKGTNMGDWQRASMVPELSVSLLKVSQLATALKGSGSIMGGLPPEPTLKDLAALGSLQERVSLLDDTVGQLQESLKLKETELLSLHREIDEKERMAKELAVKIGGLEERVTVVNNLKEGLDKAVAAEHDMESTVDRQAKTIDELTRQVSELQAEKARLESAMAALPGKQELEDLKAQVQEIKERPAPVAPLAPLGGGLPPMGGLKPEPALRPLDEPKPLVDLPAPESSPFAPAPKPKSEPFPALKPEPFSLQPAPAAKSILEAPSLSADAPAPMSSFSPLGAPPPSALDAPSPIPATIPPESAPSPVASAAAAPLVPPATDAAIGEPKKKSSPLPLILLLLLGGGGFAAFKLGLVGGRKQPAALSDRTPLPPPTAEPAKPAQPSLEDILEQKKKTAIALVQDWPGPGGKTVGELLAEGSAPTDGPTPWMAEPMREDVFQVNFYSQRPGFPSQTYEFEAALGPKKVTAHNAPARDLLAGKTAPPPKKGKRKGGKKAPKQAAGDDGPPMLEDILVVNPEDDQAAKPAEPPPAAAKAQPAQPAGKKARKSRVKQPREASLDDLLSDSAEPSPKPKVKPKPAPEKKEESLDQLLVPGSGRRSDLDEPQAQPAPMKQAPDAEAAADESASEAPAKPKKGAQGGTDAVLDDLLKP